MLAYAILRACSIEAVGAAHESTTGEVLPGRDCSIVRSVSCCARCRSLTV